jgi:hypothetical protein
MFCPVLKLREEKQAFAKVEGGNVDFFQNYIRKQPNNTNLDKNGPLQNRMRTTHKIPFSFGPLASLTSSGVCRLAAVSGGLSPLHPQSGA